MMEGDPVGATVDCLLHLRIERCRRKNRGTAGPRKNHLKCGRAMFLERAVVTWQFVCYDWMFSIR